MNRRDFLHRTAHGLGGAALASLLEKAQGQPSLG